MIKEVPLKQMSEDESFMQAIAKVECPSFDSLLRQLVGGKITGILYGDLANRERWRVGLAVRYISTPGGMQLCIKQVFSHGEGSGDYYQDNRTGVEEMKRKLITLIVYYERPVVKSWVPLDVSTPHNNGFYPEGEQP